MTNKNVTLITRIHHCDKIEFERSAMSQNLKPSELLRKLVFVEIGRTETFNSIGPAPNKINTARLTIRLAEFLLEAATQRAESKGMATSRWISALVQSHVSNAPVVTEKEALMLRAINRELSAIGRNVNQIARHLNAAPSHNAQINLEVLARLPASIDNTKQRIRAVIKSTWQGWGVEG
ncbi:plasmid mobilization relaxosome protein MobC [Pseudomonas sp. CCI3.2]|uniref:plasmid mobilization protein n=1 Tax=unclassified Pseudomonas TaxID=196821 RepID=UPI002AC8E59D|nr:MULTISPECIES: plasmid mobilization relaxosome protein MobC [unclassified Pseudomonas]MEB0079411.1 plasmid mobilization relaxosome protein MobC [Pseudomonas sp. MH10out]MEB0103765.1 plasmid mobilization relaxosome protein MobC [Pseudomonas sp. CCI3.2]MEB0132390.1 plasmid mobilization relaxosome protein MobC [Pseudomonas sp. CCI2.4]MEB0160840.1 plasmid mobilization relaxosome protein MobC [Pseudomonas sp. AH2 (2023)]MEB0169120.1 plasmid mobilization relaxosome protein MobC [Pseudomonas sp. CC